MEKDPARRYRSAGELAEEAERFLHGEPIVARPIGRAARSWRWCKRNPIVATLMLAVPMMAPAQDAAKATGLDSNLQKFSYAMGYRAARDLMQQGVLEIDKDAFGFGVGEAIGGESFRFSPEQIRQAMAGYQKELVDKRANQAVANQDMGNAFMLANAQKDGIKKFANGIQYKVIAEGSGDKPTVADTVKVHYVGTLISGVEFDSSRRRGDPAEFGVGKVIPGWQSTLAQMPVGSRWMVWIPPEMAYGLQGSGARIGPNETLVFDIELLDIVKQEPAKVEPAKAEPAKKPQ
jgi:FKBP-type peptidyl-prolyl cis-trans isomerase FklB